MSPHPDEVFTFPLRDSWFGSKGAPAAYPAHLKDAYERLIYQEYGDPPPTHEERVVRCQEMGLVLCSCTGVETEHGRRLLYDPNCPIHHGERRGVKLR